MHFICLFIALLINAFTAVAQTSSADWGCIPSTGITDLPACSSLYTIFQGCNSTATDQEYRQCLCKQSVVNNIVDCESQARFCYESNAQDAIISEYLTNWHSACDTYITFTPTSPVLSMLTTTFVLPASSNQAYCNGIAADACQDLGSSVAACLQINTAATGSQFLSCACEDSVLSLASVCSYDAAITCFSKTTAVLSDLILFSTCQKIYSSGVVITGAANGQQHSPVSTIFTPSVTSTSMPLSSTEAQTSIAAGSLTPSSSAIAASSVVSPSATASGSSIVRVTRNGAVVVLIVMLALVGF